MVSGGEIEDIKHKELENGAMEGGAGSKSQGSRTDDDLIIDDTEGGTDEAKEMEKLLRWADAEGAYERLLVWAFVAPVCLLAPCAYLNILLMVYLPPHTCSLPQPPHALSHDTWVNLTIPRDDSGNLKSCVIYDFAAALNNTSSLSLHYTRTFNDNILVFNTSAFNDDIPSFNSTTAFNDYTRDRERYLEAALVWYHRHQHTIPTNFTTECVFGYDFERTYFQETASTQFEWACGRSTGVQNILRASMLGNLFGCVIYGALADRVGRRRVFILLAVKVAVQGSAYVFIREMWVMLAVRFLVSMGLPVIYQIVIISALEQVRDERRGFVTSLSSIFFLGGSVPAGPSGLLTGHWATLGLNHQPPSLLALVYGQACAGAVNSRPDTVQWSCGPVSVFKLVSQYPRLVSGTALVTVCWTVNLILYFSTTMKYPYVVENPFLGWLCTSAMEIPANVLVLLLLPRLGRTTLHVSIMALCTAALLCSVTCSVDLVCVITGYGERHGAVAALVLIAKFCSSMTFLVTYLQAAELHPTPVRTCATGLASLVALTCNTFSPSIIFSMTRPWHTHLMLGCLGCLGVISAALLPETSGRPLPQTLEDAENLYRRIPTFHRSSGKKGESCGEEPTGAVLTAICKTSAPPSPDVNAIIKALAQDRVTETVL
nr:solute carrier family 22 member 7-like [Cherax quadricarinatus]